MKKIWSYIAMFFIGLSAGLVAMYKIMGDQIEINIRRIKTKKGQSNVTIPIDIDNAQNRPKRIKEQRKADRKAKKDG